MINRIIRKAKFLFHEFRVKGNAEFQQVVSLNSIDTILEENSKKLKPYYIEYVKNVSSPEMAASLELATFMYTLCHVKQYKRLLDMGSGLRLIYISVICKRNTGGEGLFR